MKYGQLIVGLLAGTALTILSISSSTKLAGPSAAPDKEAVEKIVRDVIANEPKLILESVKKFQEAVGKARRTR